MKILAGSDSRYLIHSKDSGGRFNYSQDDMKKVEEYLVDEPLSKNDIIGEAKFSLGLNNNFIPRTNNKYILENKDGLYDIDVTNNVKYEDTDIKDSDGKTKYSAPSFEVAFNVKLKMKVWLEI